MRRRWLSRRAVLAHVALLVVGPFCLVAGWWQLDRARSGNLLSWAYAVEWPIFAGVAVVMWWQLVHHEPGPPRSSPEGATPGNGEAPSTTPERRRDEEDPALRAYNDRLEFLAAFGRRKTWRNPHGQP